MLTSIPQKVRVITVRKIVSINTVGGNNVMIAITEADLGGFYFQHLEFDQETYCSQTDPALAPTRYQYQGLNSLASAAR